MANEAWQAELELKTSYDPGSLDRIWMDSAEHEAIIWIIIIHGSSFLCHSLLRLENCLRPETASLD